MYDNEDKNDCRGVDFDEFNSRSKSEWHDEETHRWLNAIGCTGEEAQQCASEFSQVKFQKSFILRKY